MFLKSLEQSLKTTNQKEKRYDSSLVIDRLIMTATAPNQGGSTRWFNPAAATHVESKKPTGFILLAMCKLFPSETRIKSTRPTFLMATPSPTKLLFWWYTSNLQATILVQISIQMHWDRLHTLNSTAVPSTCLQESFHPRCLLQSQKSR